MQIGRLFEIVYILMERDRVTAKDLASRFEVSVRTIYRDVETLSASGIPVYMNKGKGGGISLLSDFVLDKALITEQERKEVLSSLHALKTVGLEDQVTALDKLKNIFGSDTVDWIEVDFGFWSDGEKEATIFKKLKGAILGKREVSFYYFSMQNSQIERTVEPLKLVFKGAAWYLYAYCKLRGDYRFFKLKRIQELTVLDNYFSRHAPENVLKSNSYPQKKDNEALVKLKFNGGVAYRVYDDFRNIVILEDGSLLVNETFDFNDGLIYHLISYGENIEVLEPLELKEAVKKKLKDILDKYVVK